MNCKRYSAINPNIYFQCCAGETDINLQILGLNADGCKNLTKIESEMYAQWISDSIFQGKQKVNAKFSRVCRYSWNGCNGLPGLEIQRRVSAGGGMRSKHEYHPITPYQLLIFTFLVKRFVLFD